MTDPLSPLDVEEDSADLTDEEIATAVVTERPDETLPLLLDRRCLAQGCDGTLRPESAALRRRRPHLYMRVTLSCPQGHRENLVIRISWVSP